MKLRKIEIKKFRSISDVEININDLSMFIGENNAGKSNILRAVELFYQDSVRGINEEFFYFNRFFLNRKAFLVLEPRKVDEILGETPQHLNSSLADSEQLFGFFRLFDVVFQGLEDGYHAVDWCTQFVRKTSHDNRSELYLGFDFLQLVNVRDILEHAHCPRFVDVL